MYNFFNGSLSIISTESRFCFIRFKLEQSVTSSLDYACDLVINFVMF